MLNLILENSEINSLLEAFFLMLYHVYNNFVYYGFFFITFFQKTLLLFSSTCLFIFSEISISFNYLLNIVPLNGPIPPDIANTYFGKFWKNLQEQDLYRSDVKPYNKLYKKHYLLGYKQHTWDSMFRWHYANTKLMGHVIVQAIQLELEGYTSRNLPGGILNYIEKQSHVEYQVLHFKKHNDYLNFITEHKTKPIFIHDSGWIHVLPEVHKKMENMNKWNCNWGVVDTKLRKNGYLWGSIQEDPNKDVQLFTRSITRSDRVRELHPSSTVAHAYGLHHYLSYMIGPGYYFIPFYIFSFGLIFLTLTGHILPQDQTVILSADQIEWKNTLLHSLNTVEAQKYSGSSWSDINSVKKQIIYEAMVTKNKPNALDNIHRLTHEGILKLKCNQVLADDPINTLANAQKEIGKFAKTIRRETKADIDWRLFHDFQRHELRLAHERNLNWFQIQKIYKNDAAIVWDSLIRQNVNLGIKHKLDEALHVNLNKLQNETLRGNSKTKILEISYDLLKKRRQLDESKFHSLTIFEDDCRNAFSKLQGERKKVHPQKLFESSHKAIISAILHEKNMYNTPINQEAFDAYLKEYKAYKANINPYIFENLEKLSHKGSSVVESLEAERKKNTFFSISQEGKISANVYDRLFSSHNNVKIDFNEWRSDVFLEKAKKTSKLYKKAYPMHVIAEEPSNHVVNNHVVNNLKQYDPKKIDFRWHTTNPPNYTRLAAENFVNTLASTSPNHSLTPEAPSSPIISAPSKKGYLMFPLDDRRSSISTISNPWENNTEFSNISEQPSQERSLLTPSTTPISVDLLETRSITSFTEEKKS